MDSPDASSKLQEIIDLLKQVHTQTEYDTSGKPSNVTGTADQLMLKSLKDITTAFFGRTKPVAPQKGIIKSLQDCCDEINRNLVAINSSIGRPTQNNQSSPNNPVIDLTPLQTSIDDMRQDITSHILLFATSLNATQLPLLQTISDSLEDSLQIQRNTAWMQAEKELKEEQRRDAEEKKREREAKDKKYVDTAKDILTPNAQAITGGAYVGAMLGQKYNISGDKNNTLKDMEYGALIGGLVGQIASMIANAITIALAIFSKDILIWLGSFGIGSKLLGAITTVGGWILSLGRGIAILVEVITGLSVGMVAVIAGLAVAAKWFYDGWKNAKELLGIFDRSLTWGESIVAGLANIEIRLRELLSWLTFGLVDAPSEEEKRAIANAWKEGYNVGPDDERAAKILNDTGINEKMVRGGKFTPQNLSLILTPQEISDIANTRGQTKNLPQIIEKLYKYRKELVNDGTTGSTVIINNVDNSVVAANSGGGSFFSGFSIPNPFNNEKDYRNQFPSPSQRAS